MKDLVVVELIIYFVLSSLSGSDHRVVCHPGELPYGAASRTCGRLGVLRHLVPALCRVHHHHLEAAREQRSAHLQGNVDTNSRVIKVSMNVASYWPASGLEHT